MWLIILVIVTAGIYVLIKSNQNKATTIHANSPTSSEVPHMNAIVEEKCSSNANIKEAAEYFRPYWRWMTLAGGTDPLLYPMVSFSSDGMICITKHGYDLWTGNWKAYKSAVSREEKENALKRFAADLFRENADKVNFNIEYIADQLIEFEDPSAYTSDFTASFSFPGSFRTGEERYQFRCELQSTIIFDVDN